MSEASHVAPDGTVRMVDVGDKGESARSASARADVRFHAAATLDVLRSGRAAKGDVLATARIAGIMAAKRTADLIPLCHPLRLDHVAVDFAYLDDPPGLRITAAVSCRGPTGVEMEALTAAAVAALTVIDMLKAADPWITVSDIRLLQKSGGRHGLREPPPEMMRPSS